MGSRHALVAPASITVLMICNPSHITAVFPQATVQTCIVHLLRHSLGFVSWKDRKPVAAALKDI
jgi:hypothetical protein